jgi:hypothetical protein
MVLIIRDDSSLHFVNRPEFFNADIFISKIPIFCRFWWKFCLVFDAKSAALVIDTVTTEHPIERSSRLAWGTAGLVWWLGDALKIANNSTEYLRIRGRQEFVYFDRFSVLYVTTSFRWNSAPCLSHLTLYTMRASGAFCDFSKLSPSHGGVVTAITASAASRCYVFAFFVMISVFSFLALCWLWCSAIYGT